ncbi:MAG: hypothetical protein ACK5JU_10345 [Bacteroidales bacterium]
MKDQQRLVRKCLDNDVPVFVLCGTDINAVDTMESYYSFAEKNGCSKEFLDDLRLLINDFKKFQEEEPEKVRLPD